MKNFIWIDSYLKTFKDFIVVDFVIASIGFDSIKKDVVIDLFKIIQDFLAVVTIKKMISVITIIVITIIVLMIINSFNFKSLKKEAIALFEIQVLKDFKMTGVMLPDSVISLDYFLYQIYYGKDDLF